MAYKSDWLRSICELNGVTFSDNQMHQMNQFVELLLAFNKNVNLISRKDEENIWENHILHSISLVLKFQFPENSRIVDIGTGGGLPGIPMKILRPDFCLLLIDSIKKKVDIVEKIVHQLKFDHTQIICGRAEEIGNKEKFQHNFDFSISRAVAPLADIVKWSKPFLSQERQSSSNKIKTNQTKTELYPPALLALKGGTIEKEISVAKIANKGLNLKIVDLLFEGTTYLERNDKKVILIEF